MGWTPLNFFKYDPSKDDFSKTAFNVKQALNNNWDHLAILIDEIRRAIGLTDIDCGSWEETPVTLHNASAMAHVNLNADGNANGVVSTGGELAAHETDPNAHPNIILDGNNN
ncbi:hypothetical protein [Emergencia sp.]|uniref:hypothetical protein n=1 Tax=Emergencia sp. TaxID=1926557 RepID=UPI003AF0C1D4